MKMSGDKDTMACLMGKSVVEDQVREIGPGLTTQWLVDLGESLDLIPSVVAS